MKYTVEKDEKNIMKLREVLSTLPSFAKDYFRAKEYYTSTKTRISYAYDIRLFFSFLMHENAYFKKYKSMADITLSDLEKIKPIDIEEYMEYLKYYQDENGQIHKNKELGVTRKLAALKSFYHYYFKQERLSFDPTLLVDMPKHHKKEIIRLDPNEVANLLDFVEHGDERLTARKQIYFRKNKSRNLAIFTLLLGTGIRVSECVGLDITDLDFENNRMKIIRKGGKESFIYFGTEVEKALKKYLEERKEITPHAGYENALFLSLQKKRLCIQAIENLVTDYSKYITTVKHITPHKLRSTYGTNLYRETGDIYLVAEVLGHNDVNTTRKHYAAIDEDRKRMAANAIQLREDI